MRCAGGVIVFFAFIIMPLIGGLLRDLLRLYRKNSWFWWLERSFGVKRYFSYILTLAICSYFTTYRVVLFGTSFFPYFVYMSTYGHAKDDDENKKWCLGRGAFKKSKTTLFFMSIAFGEAAALFYGELDLSAWSFLCAAVILSGYCLTLLSYYNLQDDKGLYFGWELNLVLDSEDWMASFPYGTIPHPMISGGVLSWIGFHMLPAFRAEHPYFAAVHIVLFGLHMTQEVVQYLRDVSAMSPRSGLMSMADTVDRVIDSTGVSPMSVNAKLRTLADKVLARGA
jgi:hypothetical protein